MLVAVCEDLQKDALQVIEMLERYRTEKQLDLEARVFDSAEELLDAFEPGAFQIVFMDVLLGGLTGVEAVRKIRSRDEDCAVIFITTSREPVRILTRDIRCAEVFKNLCVIHTVNEDVKAYTSIDALEEKLGGTPFLRCHRSYIVNPRRVTDLRLPLQAPKRHIAISA